MFKLTTTPNIVQRAFPRKLEFNWTTLAYNSGIRKKEEFRPPFLPWTCQCSYTSTFMDDPVPPGVALMELALDVTVDPCASISDTRLSSPFFKHIVVTLMVDGVEEPSSVLEYFNGLSSGWSLSPVASRGRLALPGGYGLCRCTRRRGHRSKLFGAEMKLNSLRHAKMLKSGESAEKAITTTVIPKVLDSRSEIFFLNITIPIVYFFAKEHYVSHPLLVGPSGSPNKLLDTTIRLLVV
ncbi:hypothetical protein EDB86DRAFT_2830936 [Lactarius hatsudake]|nr:hypothetical protein EDB86DRAFT_2830936 [Lactarius hatsudake]